MTNNGVYPHIAKEPGQSASLIRVPRVRVAQLVMDYLFHGWSVDEMCRQHPYLSRAEAHAAMCYYFDHQEEIDSEIRHEVDQDEAEGKSKMSPLYLKLTASAAASRVHA